MARTEREKRMLMVLGATVAVALVLVLVTTVFARGSKDPAAGPRAVPAAPNAPAPAPVPSTEPSPELSTVPLVFHGVDPFEPLVNTKPAKTKEAAAPAPAETPAGPASAVVGGKTVTLVDIFEKNGKERAHVDVDGTTYAAGPGDNFYEDYVLVSIADPCVQFAWRDQSFRLCVQPGSGG